VTRPNLDRRDLESEVCRFVEWLDESPLATTATVEYRPPMDVVETADAVEIVADLPGVQADSIRVLFNAGTLLIAGHKRAASCGHREAMFHLAERRFGEFACGVRLTVAIDAGRARATLKAGELHVRLPRIEDQRGREIPITVESA